MSKEFIGGFVSEIGTTVRRTILTLEKRPKLSRLLALDYLSGPIKEKANKDQLQTRLEYLRNPDNADCSPVTARNIEKGVRVDKYLVPITWPYRASFRLTRLEDLFCDHFPKVHEKFQEVLFTRVAPVLASPNFHSRERKPVKLLA